MPTIPTISQLYTDILADLQTAYNNNPIPVFGRVFLRADAAVQAAKLYLFYLAAANVQKNIFVDTADPESIGGTLERFGRVKIGRNPNPAVAGQYTCSVTGISGSTIPAQQTFTSSDTSANPGFVYQLDTAFTFSGTTGTITLRALTPGTESALEVGNTLSPASPVTGLNSTVTVTAISTTPAAAETIEDYRAEILQSYLLESQGGSRGDYRLWAADAQGVAQVYPYATSGQSAEIDLYIEATIADSTDGHGTPSAGIIADVVSVVTTDPDTSLPLNERSRFPLGVLQINYYAVTPLPVNVTITNYTNLTAAKQSAIQTAIEELLANTRPFIAGADAPDSDGQQILNTAKLTNAVYQGVSNSIFTSLSMEVNSVALASYTFTNGNIPYLNTLTFA